MNVINLIQKKRVKQIFKIANKKKLTVKHNEQKSHRTYKNNGRQILRLINKQRNNKFYNKANA